jgi:opacity protein-like surface antigen
VEILEGLPATEIPRTPPSEAITQIIPKPESKFLPNGLLFDPLHADPRWPHFSVGYRRISEGPEPEKTGSANFGETFAIYRNAALLDGQWEIAFQGGVFSIFNLDASSKDLVNADYTVGLLASYRTGSFSSFIRLHHQSSHLGDEFIINTNPDRINLAFEEVDLKLSYNLWEWFRVYGGGGYLVGRDPNNLGRGTSQFGSELTSPWTMLSGKIRPVAYADFQINERSNWSITRSLMAGLQFENARIGDRKLQVLFEYLKGPSPNGQFFSQRTDWIGVGLHLYY